MLSLSLSVSLSLCVSLSLSLSLSLTLYLSICVCVCLSLSLSQYWEHRLQQLVFVREQLNSGEVLHILSGLEHARSTYANAFIDVHRDISKVH